ncbi:hypothetical protein DR999_PMT18768 [Platysternon megacephalum]|uniref:Uncharacterized protein n=1 Tax=Platysternon megacephalum TaxID=55544 RepID=A0A4D9DVT8_9SAUR|nr:hypothetical protein DR999_PMT18768 [Platysternon megacephalum]
MLPRRCGVSVLSSSHGSFPTPGLCCCLPQSEDRGPRQQGLVGHTMNPNRPHHRPGLLSSQSPSPEGGNPNGNGRVQRSIHKDLPSSASASVMGCSEEEDTKAAVRDLGRARRGSRRKGDRRKECSTPSPLMVF